MGGRIERSSAWDGGQDDATSTSEVQPQSVLGSASQRDITATPRPASRAHVPGLVPAVFAEPNASAVRRGQGGGRLRSSSAGMSPTVVAEVSPAVADPAARRPRCGCGTSREEQGGQNIGCCAGSGRGCDRLGWSRNSPPACRWSRPSVPCAYPSSQIGFLDRQSSGTGVVQSGDVGHTGPHIPEPAFCSDPARCGCATAVHTAALSNCSNARRAMSVSRTPRRAAPLSSVMTA